MTYLFTDTTYEEFTLELKLLPLYRTKLKNLRERYDLEIYRMSGLKGMNPNKSPGSSNQEFIQEMKLEHIDELEPLTDEIKRLSICIRRTEKMLKSLDGELGNMLKRIYVNGDTLNSVCTERNISEPTKLLRELKHRYNDEKKGFEY